MNPSADARAVFDRGRSLRRAWLLAAGVASGFACRSDPPHTAASEPTAPLSTGSEQVASTAVPLTDALLARWRELRPACELREQELQSAAQDPAAPQPAYGERLVDALARPPTRTRDPETGLPYPRLEPARLPPDHNRTSATRSLRALQRAMDDAQRARTDAALSHALGVLERACNGTAS